MTTKITRLVAAVTATLGIASGLAYAQGAGGAGGPATDPANTQPADQRMNTGTADMTTTTPPADNTTWNADGTAPRADRN